jgi:RNA polymerase sigma-70 factor (ECF subfamily)
LGHKDKYSNEAELIDAIRSGDHEAFRWLADRYQEKVIRTCKGFVHSNSDAQDIAQDVFIEVYQSISKFRGDSGISTWIYRIAVNKSLNFLRSISRRKIFSIFENNDEEKYKQTYDSASSHENLPDDNLIRSEQSAAILEAVDSLPFKQRTAFVLNKYEDLTYQEVAAVMNTTVHSVESLLFRAKHNLQKKLYVFYKKNIR